MIFFYLFFFISHRVSPMIREFVQSVDDREWQSSLFSLLQSQTYNQCEVDLFELMCKVLDQNLFSQVDWARNTIFFKDLKVIFNFFCIMLKTSVVITFFDLLVQLSLTASHFFFISINFFSLFL